MRPRLEPLFRGVLRCLTGMPMIGWAACAVDQWSEPFRFHSHGIVRTFSLGLLPMMSLRPSARCTECHGRLWRDAPHDIVRDPFEVACVQIAEVGLQRVSGMAIH